MTKFCLDPPGDVASGVLSEMILAIEALATFCTDVTFFTRVYDKVQGQLLLSFEGFKAYGANIRSFRIVALLMTGEVILAF